jgi:hypothetical protein
VLPGPYLRVGRILTVQIYKGTEYSPADQYETTEFTSGLSLAYLKDQKHALKRREIPNTEATEYDQHLRYIQQTQCLIKALCAVQNSYGGKIGNMISPQP